MKARVEELVLRYRLPRDAPRLHAQLPSIERALHSRLADEIASQLEAIDEGSEEVIVVREATAHVTLRIGEHARDAAALERVAQAARETVVALLARPADDDEQVRRFPSDAAYAGSFIVELLGGTAWDRWYFDSFSRFRRADARTTVVALLAGADTECMALFAWLEQNMEKLLAHDTKALTYVIRKSCEIKASIVGRDEREQGDRALLNLGHTFGHALESATGYTKWLHGEAVGAGLLMAATMSCESGLISAAAVERLRKLLVRTGLPTEERDVRVGTALEHMRIDKKVKSGRIRLVLLRSIGASFVTADYADAALQRTLEAHLG